MGTGNGFDSSPPSWPAPSANLVQIAIEIGRIQSKLDQQTLLLTQHTAALTQVLASLRTILTAQKHSSLPSTPPTASPKGASKRSALAEWILQRLSKDVMGWVLGKIWQWLVRYALPYSFALGGLIRMIYRWFAG